MAGNISSLGIGSGVLTADVLDQLKKADESATIKPIDAKITANQQKQSAYSLLSSLVSSLGSNSSALKYDTIFDKKSVSVSGDAGVTLDAGASIESFTLETLTLAKKDTTKLGSMSSRESIVASTAGVLKINDLEISYDGGITLEDLAQAINDQAGDTVSASILQTNEGAFNLVISSKETGANQALTITDTDGSGGAGFLDAALFNAYDEITNPYGYEKIQTASDATFKYNGILTTRSTNTIDDLAVGLNITLKKEGDSSNVTISNDYSSIASEFQLFVESYNALMSNLNDMTTFDEEKGVKGIFNDDSFVKSIARDLVKTVTEYDASGNSLANYGISISEKGVMSFDKSILDAKIAEDADAVKLFFSGGTDSEGNEVKGIFTKIDEKVDTYTDSGGLLGSYSDGLKKEGTSLTKSKTLAQESLDSRYEMMARRFASYDAIISKINSQFSSLKMMIDAEASSKD